MLSTIWIDLLFPVTRSGMEQTIMDDKIDTAAGGYGQAKDSLRVILLLFLFGLTFGAIMMATFLRGDWARAHVTSFVACIGGGVFLATCMLDLLPEALESFEKAGVKVNFPVAEGSVIAGLLIVLSMEQMLLSAQERGWIGHERFQLHDHSVEEDSISNHEGTEAQEHSVAAKLSAIMLVVALSLHALFEGLSLAVIEDAPKLLEVFAALILHKCIIGFSLGIRLVQSGLTTPWVALGGFLFSIQVLVGGLCGIAIMAFISGGERSTAAIVASIMQGIACGTFLYITTFEIVPHEMDKKGHRLTKLFFLFVGVMLVITLMFIFPEP